MISPEPWLSHLTRHLEAVRATGNVEDVHQLRVAIARLRVWLSLGAWRVLQDDLRWLRDVASAARDYDVQLAHGPPPRWASYLNERREQARRQLVRALETERSAGVALALGAMRAVPRDRAVHALEGFLRQALDRGHRLAGTSDHNLAALHGLRCAVRRVRYALEWLDENAAELIALQDAIGDACDRFVALKEVLRHGSGHHAGRRHARRLERQLHTDVRRALTVWEAKRPILKELLENGPFRHSPRPGRAPLRTHRRRKAAFDGQGTPPVVARRSRSGPVGAALRPRLPQSVAPRGRDGGGAR